MQYERCTRRPRSFRVAVAAIVCFVIAVAASSGTVLAYASTPPLGWLDSEYADSADAGSIDGNPGKSSSDSSQSPDGGFDPDGGGPSESPSHPPDTAYDKLREGTAGRGESGTDANGSADDESDPNARSSARGETDQHPAKAEHRLAPLILLDDPAAVTSAKQETAQASAVETWLAKKEAAARESGPDWSRVFSDALVTSSAVGAIACAVAGCVLLRTARRPHPSRTRRRARPHNTKRR